MVWKWTEIAYRRPTPPHKSPLLGPSRLSFSAKKEALRLFFRRRSGSATNLHGFRGRVCLALPQVPPLPHPEERFVSIYWSGRRASPPPARNALGGSIMHEEGYSPASHFLAELYRCLLAYADQFLPRNNH